MRKSLVLIFTVLVLLVSFVPTSSAEDQVKDQHVSIKTTQGDSAFVPMAEDGMIIYRTWEVQFFSTSQNNEYKVLKDGKVILEGSFDEAGFYSEKAVVGLGHSAKITVKLNDEEYVYNNVSVMRKSVTKKDIKNQKESKSLTMKFRTFVLHNIKSVIVGMVTSIGAFLFAYVVVRNRKKNEILEGV